MHEVHGFWGVLVWIWSYWGPPIFWPLKIFLIGNNLDRIFGFLDLSWYQANLNLIWLWHFLETLLQYEVSQIPDLAILQYTNFIHSVTIRYKNCEAICNIPKYWYYYRRNGFLATSDNHQHRCLWTMWEFDPLGIPLWTFSMKHSWPWRIWESLWTLLRTFFMDLHGPFSSLPSC